MIPWYQKISIKVLFGAPYLRERGAAAWLEESHTIGSGDLGGKMTSFPRWEVIVVIDEGVKDYGEFVRGRCEPRDAIVLAEEALGVIVTERSMALSRRFETITVDKQEAFLLTVIDVRTWKCVGVAVFI